MVLILQLSAYCCILLDSFNLEYLSSLLHVSVQQTIIEYYFKKLKPEVFLQCVLSLMFFRNIFVKLYPVTFR